MFDTCILDEALKDRRARLRREQTGLLDLVRHTLRELRGPLKIEAAYIIGSLRTPDAWHPSSDVDVAVRGQSLDVLELMKALEIATDRDVDVIDLDRHPAADTIVRSGLKIYG